MNCLGRSLHEGGRDPKYYFKYNAVLSVAIHASVQVVALHQDESIHRDIKVSNFVTGTRVGTTAIQKTLGEARKMQSSKFIIIAATFVKQSNPVGTAMLSGLPDLIGANCSQLQVQPFTEWPAASTAFLRVRTERTRTCSLSIALTIDLVFKTGCAGGGKCSC